MRWFWKWIFRKIKTIDSCEVVAVSGRDSQNSLDESAYTRFNVYHADGGHVIQVFNNPGSYSTNKPSNHQNHGPKMYVVSDSDELSSKIMDILIMEKMRS